MSIPDLSRPEESKFPKNSSTVFKILIVLGILLGGSLLFFLKRGLPASSLCNNDAECFLVYNLDDCCWCPQAINISQLKNNKRVVKYPSSLEKSPDMNTDRCRQTACQPCAFGPEVKCVDQKCLVVAKKVELLPTPTILLPVSPGPTALIKVSGAWKAYQNQKLGLVIKYPSNFLTNEFKGIAWQGAVPGELIVEFKEAKSIKDSRFPSILVGYYENPERVPLSLWFEQKSTEADFFDPALENKGRLFFGVKNIRLEEGGELTRIVFESSSEVPFSVKNALLAKEDKIFLIQSLKNKLGNFDSIFDLMLPTIRFFNKDAENFSFIGQYCGGIFGNLPENQCPVGYLCKINEDFLDAGGVCVKAP